MARDSTTRDGEEIVVETGTGHLVTLTEVPGKRNAQVSFKATHTDLRLPITAWLDTHDETLLEHARAAHVGGIEVEYRIEVHRKAKIDKSIPLDKVANVDKVRDLVLLAPLGTNAGETPPTTPEPPSEPEPSQPSTDTTDPSPSAGPTGDPESSPGPGETAPPRERAARHVAEAKAWEPLNSDGTPNLGAYAVTAGAGMVDVAVELLLAGGVELKLAAIRTVSTDLMLCADEIQAGATGYRPDRMANSHTRARGLLRTVLRARPYPLDKVLDEHGAIQPTAAKAAGAWHEKAAPAGVALLRLAVELAGIDWRDPA